MTNQILGRLIGLARATDGNEHMISQSSTNVIIEALSALADSMESDDLLEAILQEKQKMVPDCFFCANPCGKNDDFDMNNLLKEDFRIVECKHQILSKLQALAVKLRKKQSFPDRNTELLLYQGLIVIGMDCISQQDLLSILDRL